MRVVRLAVAGSLLALMFAGTAAAQGYATPDLRQPMSIQRTAFASDDYLSYAPQNETAPSPSDQPPPAATVEKPALVAGGEFAEPAEEEQGFKLFKAPWLECHRIDIRGWLDQGYTWNSDSPVNRFNTPVAYDDRANEYQLNQLYLLAERVTNTCGCGWDIGGRVDLLYGTDRRFPFAIGLDDRWNESERFYGLVMPQLYADFAYNNLIFRAGHFLAPCGYESVMAPQNFFYSHTYSFLYGQPTTLTGGSLIYKFNDQLSGNVGIDNGWNNWDNLNQRLSYFGGFNWTSANKKTTAALEVFSGDQLESPQSVLSHCCLVFTHKLTDKWTLATEQNYAVQTDTAVGTVRWWGVAGYAFYELNKCWSVGMRFEHFEDPEGFVVPFATGVPLGIPSHFNAVTWGVNYKPNANVIVRSSLRSDSGHVPDGTPIQPFDDLTKSHQFLWGTDLIVKF